MVVPRAYSADARDFRWRESAPSCDIRESVQRDDVRESAYLEMQSGLGACLKMCPDSKADCTVSSGSLDQTAGSSVRGQISPSVVCL